MIIPSLPSAAPKFLGLLLGLSIAATSGHAAGAPASRLVHCGADTCLRISGHRPDPAVAVRIGGHELAVEGGRNWRATVPLTTARAWVPLSADMLTLTFADTVAGTETRETVMLPPGALGTRVELASLVVRAH